ncbi:MAG TPA: sigma-70 family RNA polymerase sigma factor, partial [Frankiaceae bacterium]|nr:sigma-70 family RNA polymerase sigma factor [Frankiaceae bacterium]
MREHWWAAVSGVIRATGDLAAAEDAAQDACLAALTSWPTAGVPANPRAWLISTARHKALDTLRREARRGDKEAAAVRELDRPGGDSGDRPGDTAPEDQLALIFLCCHPAFDPQIRVALTLRAVCGLSTTQIAAVFLLPEPTVAKRLVRARRKIRDTGIRLAPPTPDALAERLTGVLRVVYLVFTEGHRASSGPTLVREDLCDTAVVLARTLSALLPDEPEVTGLLALLLLTDARRSARTDDAGQPVLLAEQDRARYDPVLLAEGKALLERALRAGRPGPYQVQAAIAACHCTARTAQDTDWREIAALYGELLRYEPSPVHEANRAVAVAMAEGPAAGLVVLDAVAHHPQLARWPALHVARADLLSRLGRTRDAVAA